MAKTEFLVIPVFLVILASTVFASASTIYFSNTYSNGGWSQVGSSVTIDSLFFPGVVKFNNEMGGGGVTQNRMVHHLPSPLPLNWTADFDYEFTASNIPAAYPFALTSTSADPELQGPSGSDILVYHGDNSDVLHLRVQSVTVVNDFPGLYTGIPISPNKMYFVQLERTPTKLKLSVFSDSARTKQIPGSPITAPISTSDLTDLNFIQHSGSRSSGPARTLTAQVDNTKIFVAGTNQILFSDHYSGPLWTQVGTSITLNSLNFPGVTKFNNVAGGGGVDESRVLKHISSSLPSTWTADFGYKFTSSNIPAFIIFSLTPGTSDPQSQKSSNQITIEHGDGVNQLFEEYYPAGIASTGIPISPNKQYYIQLEKTPAQLKLSVFSDSARTIHVAGSPVVLDITGTNFNNLNYVQHDGCRDCGPARTLTAQIDNMNIFAP